MTLKKGGKDNGDVKEDQPKMCKASSPGVSPSDVERVDQVTTDAKWLERKWLRLTENGDFNFL